jgi:hypothetical protein
MKIIEASIKKNGKMIASWLIWFCEYSVPSSGEMFEIINIPNN